MEIKFFGGLWVKLRNYIDHIRLTDFSVKDFILKSFFKTTFPKNKDQLIFYFSIHNKSEKNNKVLKVKIHAVNLIALVFCSGLFFFKPFSLIINLFGRAVIWFYATCRKLRVLKRSYLPKLEVSEYIFCKQKKNR